MSTKAISGCTECGWTSKRTTPAHADKAYRLHSCEKKRREDEVTARSRARDAAVDRTPKPCLHKRATHEHGTYACYVLDFCRCLPCASANSRYESARVRSRAYGRAAYVDAGPAREHVLSLMAAGIGWKRVARLSGVPTGAMSKLLYGTTGRGPSVRIRPATADRILAVQAPALADGAVVDGTGTRRRLQALVVAGWSQNRLAARLGMLATNFGPLILGQRQPTAATARAVAGLFEELWNTPPTATSGYERAGIDRARAHAAAKGWAPAMAWDEDTIDDPAAAPQVAPQPELTDTAGVDEAAVDRRLSGDHHVPLTTAERWVVIRRLHAAGFTDQDIHARTGIHSDQVCRDRRRLGLRANAPSARHERQTA